MGASPSGLRSAEEAASPSAPAPPAPADDDELADALAALLQAETAAAAAPPSSEDDLEALKALAGPGWKARLAPAAIAAAVAAAPEPQNGTHGSAKALDPVRPQMKKLLALNRMTAEEREAKGKQFILQKTKKYLITIGDHIAKAIEEGSIKPCEEKDAWRTVREVSKNSLTADKLAEIYRKLKVRQAVQGRQEDKRLADAGE